MHQIEDPVQPSPMEQAADRLVHACLSRHNLSCYTVMEQTNTDEAAIYAWRLVRPIDLQCHPDLQKLLKSFGDTWGYQVQYHCNTEMQVVSFQIRCPRTQTAGGPPTHPSRGDKDMTHLGTVPAAPHTVQQDQGPLAQCTVPNTPTLSEIGKMHHAHARFPMQRRHLIGHQTPEISEYVCTWLNNWQILCLISQVIARWYPQPDSRITDAGLKLNFWESTITGARCPSLRGAKDVLGMELVTLYSQSSLLDKHLDFTRIIMLEILWQLDRDAMVQNIKSVIQIVNDTCTFTADRTHRKFWRIRILIDQLLQRSRQTGINLLDIQPNIWGLLIWVTGREKEVYDQLRHMVYPLECAGRIPAAQTADNIARSIQQRIICDDCPSVVTPRESDEDSSKSDHDPKRQHTSYDMTYGCSHPSFGEPSGNETHFQLYDRLRQQGWANSVAAQTNFITLLSTATRYGMVLSSDVPPVLVTKQHTASDDVSTEEEKVWGQYFIALFGEQHGKNAYNAASKLHQQIITLVSNSISRKKTTIQFRWPELSCDDDVAAHPLILCFVKHSAIACAINLSIILSKTDANLKKRCLFFYIMHSIKLCFEHLFPTTNAATSYPAIAQESTQWWIDLFEHAHDEKSDMMPLPSSAALLHGHFHEQRPLPSSPLVLQFKHLHLCLLNIIDVLGCWRNEKWEIVEPAFFTKVCLHKPCFNSPLWLKWSVFERKSVVITLLMFDIAGSGYKLYCESGLYKLAPCSSERFTLLLNKPILQLNSSSLKEEFIHLYTLLYNLMQIANTALSNSYNKSLHILQFGFYVHICSACGIPCLPEHPDTSLVFALHQELVDWFNHVVHEAHEDVATPQQQFNNSFWKAISNTGVRGVPVPPPPSNIGQLAAKIVELDRAVHHDEVSADDSDYGTLERPPHPTTL